jgi:acetyltransferase-like isoleucine patch superfamily enzyme
MSLLWNLLDGGYSMPGRQTWGQRLTLWCGRRLALRHRHVRIPPSCRIHPEARIHPRHGRMSFGERCTIAAGAVIQGNVELGDDCSVQIGSMLLGYGDREDLAGRIHLGKGVRIAPYVIMIGGDHNFDDPDTPIHQQGIHKAPIIIEDDVWIASRVNITAGVTIGRGSVVGAGAVVTADVPPYSVAVGVPARVVRRRGQTSQQT